MTAPFTAEDTKFSIELLVNPSFKSARRAGHKLVKDINVVSPTEINWRMEKPYAPYPSILAWTFMVPQHILGEEKDPNTAAFNSTPVGTGPFKWGERVAGYHILLAANDKFLDKGPYVERLVMKHIPDLTVLFTQGRARA
jgi:peptide/nickel transport system substrate-binding protein